MVLNFIDSCPFLLLYFYSYNVNAIKFIGNIKNHIEINNVESVQVLPDHSLLTHIKAVVICFHRNILMA